VGVLQPLSDKNRRAVVFPLKRFGCINDASYASLCTLTLYTTVAVGNHGSSDQSDTNFPAGQTDIAP
jgi:hypothetical protein